MPNEIVHAASEETKEHLAFLLTQPALRNLPLSKTEAELREWLSLLVEFFQTSENIDPNFLEETLETLRFCIEKCLNKRARSCSETAPRAGGSFEGSGLRSLEFLLVSLDLIVKVTLEKSRNDEYGSGLVSDIAEGHQASKNTEQHSGTVRSTASSALKALSGWFASSESNRSAASLEHGESSGIRVLMRSSPIWLRTVSDAYRTHSTLYRRCKSIVEGLLVRNLAEYITALAIASAEISGRSVFASDNALQFLRSAIKLSTDSERVTLPAFFTAVGLVGNAIALQQNRLLLSSTPRGRSSQLSEKQHTEISLPRAGVALLTTSGMKGTSAHGHSSKSRGIESKQLGEETREQRRLLSRFFSMSDDELRHHLGGLHSHVLAVSFLWTSVMVTKDCVSDEALASLRAFMDASIMHYVEPACPLVLLRTVYKFVELSASERTTFPLEFLERIRVVVETVVGIAGEDWHLPNLSDTGQTVSEPDIRLAFSILALECLAEYVPPLIEIIFREDRVMRKKMLCAVCDVALRALKATSGDDEDESSHMIAKEVLASFGTYDGTSRSTFRGRF
ncbi:hypothetical protein F1559_002513 [Cyanidiococcus yangmingshanensis]|uniref:Uncharacterized protein n=1 Tax=Cyanidiococcus yangmingshanensis TaxID=2690220 RepID=A0A7J7IG62_9RHOD|nr:hypothetical protein F1559_002513 [Cyanidiococcus yangmingshanensis]